MRDVTKTPPASRAHGWRLDVATVGTCLLIDRPVTHVVAIIGILTMSLTLPIARAQKVDKRLETAAELISQKKIQEAEQQLTQILKRTPNDALAINMLGTIRAQQGKLNEAESFFLRAIQLDSQLIGPRMNLAYLYSLKKESD